MTKPRQWDEWRHILFDNEPARKSFQSRPHAVNNVAPGSEVIHVRVTEIIEGEEVRANIQLAKESLDWLEELVMGLFDTSIGYVGDSSVPSMEEWERRMQPIWDLVSGGEMVPVPKALLIDWLNTHEDLPLIYSAERNLRDWMKQNVTE